jgi:hypothetical protein
MKAINPTPIVRYRHLLPMPFADLPNRIESIFQTEIGDMPFVLKTMTDCEKLGRVRFEYFRNFHRSQHGSSLLTAICPAFSISTFI